MSKFLHLRRPTTYSRLQQSIPKPPQALPQHGGLPQWQTLGLDQKLPANACPIHPPTFSCGRLGQYLWSKPLDYGFDLTDPLGHDVSFHYLMLHDKHLKGYYRSKKIKDGLKNHNLITDREETICSLVEFNRFRNYLWKFHKHEMRKEFKKLDRNWLQAHRNKTAVLHMKKHYDFEGTLERKKCIVNGFRESKRQKILKAVAKYNRKLNKFLERRERNKQSKLIDGHLRALKVTYNHALLNASRKSYRLRLKRRLRENDNMRARRMAIIKRRIRESRRIMKKERHKMLFISAQEAEVQRQTQLDNFLQHMERNVQRRMVRSAIQQERFERQMVRRKTRNLTSKYDKRSKPALMRAMLKAWHSIQVRQPEVGAVRQLSRSSVENAVNIAYSMHMTISPTISSTQIIETARQLMTDLATMPSEQLPLDQQTIKYTSDALIGIMGQIKKQVVSAGCNLVEQVATKTRKRFDSDDQRQRQSSLCGPWSQKWKRSPLRSTHSDIDRPHRVSIGEVQIVNEYQTEQEHFKSSRLRPPTPVTSLTSLVEHIVDSEEELMLSSCESSLEIPSAVTAQVEKRITEEDHPLIHLTARQKRFLETNLIKFRAIVQRNVETRALTAIDVMRLEIVRRKLPRPKKNGKSLANEAARCILVFPKEDQKYAGLLLDIINLLVVEIYDKLDDILKAP